MPRRNTQLRTCYAELPMCFWRGCSCVAAGMISLSWLAHRWTVTNSILDAVIFQSGWYALKSRESNCSLNASLFINACTIMPIAHFIAPARRGVKKPPFLHVASRRIVFARLFHRKCINLYYSLTAHLKRVNGEVTFLHTKMCANVCVTYTQQNVLN